MDPLSGPMIDDPQPLAQLGELGPLGHEPPSRPDRVGLGVDQPRSSTR